MTTIKKATIAHVESIAYLFNSYRIFYKQKSNYKAAVNFLTERIKKNESDIFFAIKDNEVVGFTQLYTTFSSVSLEKIFILNDLYVSENQRSKNIGADLLNKAKEYCLEKKYKGLALETAKDNPAQKLYEKLGWEKDTHCFHYFWSAK